MKRTILTIALLLVAATTYAQQPKAIADAKPAAETAIKMPAEYVSQITALLQESKKLQDDNAQLISAWKDYLAQQNAKQNQINIVAMRAAMKAGMTVEQMDASDLMPDGKGGFEWRAKAKPETAKAKP